MSLTRRISLCAAAAALAIASLPTWAQAKIKVAAIYTVPVEQQWVSRIDKALKAAVARGDRLGALHGVPVTIKENVDQKGCATTNGVEAFADLIAGDDAPVVANLRKAGAIIIGRTNTPEFSYRWFTDNPLRGLTQNPWSDAHTPGGSSGGSAAASRRS